MNVNDKQLHLPVQAWFPTATTSGRGRQENGKGYLPAEEDTPIIDGMLKQALQDARQVTDSGLQGEALAWLWVCCPDIADELLLPYPQVVVDLQQQATSYTYRFAAM